MVDNDIFYEGFISYLKKANDIFDIMAAAYKIIIPFEPQSMLASDAALNEMIKGYSEQDNIILGFIDLKERLYEWSDQQKGIDINEFKKKMFCLVRLIDINCVEFSESSLPNPYSQYDSLNSLFHNEIVILPRYQDNAIELLSVAISRKADKKEEEKEENKEEQEQGYGFFGSNYDRTAYISGYLSNFIIYDNDKSLIKPRMNILNKGREIKNEFKQNGNKLRVGIFPLSNVNLRRIFALEEDLLDTVGVFGIGTCDADQETLIYERCKEALKICKDHRVDIAVFPEMLFSRKNQEALIGFVQNNQEDERRFPWFTWLGTSWADRENKCIVIDQYGKKVFEQNKYVSYEYSKMDSVKGKITYVENLSHDKDWTINFLDIPRLLRIATAICRDISSGPLIDSIKKLYTDMVVIPAFSGSDRLTHKCIDPIVMEKMIVLVCNACSSQCDESQDKFVVNKEDIGKEHIFCYLCMPAKCETHNVVDYHTAKYNPDCIECDRCCKGYVWEISFSECIEKDDLLAANVT